jgi:hypothetical protein
MRTCGYARLDAALIEIGDNDLDNWEYLGCSQETDVYGYKRFKKSCKKYPDLKDDIRDDKCICGVRIEIHHVIRHKQTGVFATIGSTCRNHWGKSSPEFFKDRCSYCDQIMVRRNHNLMHTKCKKKKEMEDRRRAIQAGMRRQDKIRKRDKIRKQAEMRRQDKIKRQAEIDRRAEMEEEKKRFNRYKSMRAAMKTSSVKKIPISRPISRPIDQKYVDDEILAFCKRLSKRESSQ